jgi:hypothetical protein
MKKDFVEGNCKKCEGYEKEWVLWTMGKNTAPLEQIKSNGLRLKPLLRSVTSQSCHFIYSYNEYLKSEKDRAFI